MLNKLLTCLFASQPFERFIRTGITSLFGLSNIYLIYNSTDYFAQPTEFNPFTHTWSLDVEEQFYLFFPLIIWYSGFAKQTLKSLDLSIIFNNYYPINYFFYKFISN